MRVIEFEPKERLLDRARRYVDDPEMFLSNVADATRVLLRAIRHAAPELRLGIEMLMQTFGEKQKLVDPLYAILRDPSETEDARHDAAVQLSLIAERLAETEDLVRRLIEDAESDDAELRLHATCALGWGGNRDATVPLLERLHDRDERVRRVAVFALTNLRDDRLIGALLDRLQCASREQQRAILFNLWRFYTRQEDAASVYLRFTEHEDAETRFDALVLLGQVSAVGDQIEVYRARLRDPDARIRRHALKMLSTLPSDRLEAMRADLPSLVDDPDIGVKRVTLAILDRIGRSGPVTLGVP